MARRPVLPTLIAALVLAVPAAADAASLETDRRCYNERAGMDVRGEGFTPRGVWTVTAPGLSGTGRVRSDGTFRSDGAPAPVLTRRTTRPRRVTLSASEGGRRVARTRIDVVNLLVTFGSTGRPKARTRWRFSGFDRGKSVYLHVRRGGRTVKTVRMGRADERCGRLSTKKPRLPGVRSSRIRPGTYAYAIDSRRRYSSRTRPQYRTGITIARR